MLTHARSLECMLTYLPSACTFLQLLEHGADANYNNLKSVVSAAKANGLQPTKNFGTALHEAAKQGCDTIVDMLIRSGAEPWILNR